MAFFENNSTFTGGPGDKVVASRSEVDKYNKLVDKREKAMHNPKKWEKIDSKMKDMKSKYSFTMEKGNNNTPTGYAVIYSK